MVPVIHTVLSSGSGIRAVGLEAWSDFQTALMLLFLTPLVMAPTRESIVALLVHPAFFDLDCFVCGCKDCKGNRIEYWDAEHSWALRIGHHKTDSITGVQLRPIAEDLAGLVCLWSYASLRYTGRREGVHSLFYSLESGDPFTESSISNLLVGKLSRICGDAGVSVTTIRGIRHMFSTGFMTYSTTVGAHNIHLQAVRKDIARMMGTSLRELKVGSGMAQRVA